MTPLDKHRGIITFHGELGVLPPQSRQLDALVLAQPTVAPAVLALAGRMSRVPWNFGGGPVVIRLR
jgi:hypothetical protein